MKRVLFVESDHPKEGSFASLLDLSETNWVILYASSAEKALEFHREDPCDIVVTANRLPKKSGLKLLSILKEISPDTIRFLVIDEGDKNKFKSLISDAQQILVNPLDQSSFVQKVNRALSLREIFSDSAILKLVGNADSLPPLPRVFKEVSEMLQDPETALSDVAECIAEDIVMSSKLLKLSNSALFNLAEPARNISQSVSLLGGAMVSSLVFSFGIRESFGGDRQFEQFVEEVNRHSIECSRMISNILFTWGAERELIDKAIFCAMAHDLGKLVLARYAPEAWLQILEEVDRNERPDYEIEREIVGVCHGDVAAYILALWGFLNDEIIAVAFHHEPSRVEENEPGVLCALYLAEYVCDSHLKGKMLDWDYLKQYGVEENDIIALKALKEV